MHTDLDVCVCLCMPLTFYLFAYKRRLNPIAASTPALPTLSATPQLFHGASRLGCCVHFWSVSVRDWHFFSLHFKCNLPLAHVCMSASSPSTVQSAVCRLPFAVCHWIRQLLRLRVRHALWRLWVCGVRNTEKKVSRCKWILTKDTHPPTATLAHSHSHTGTHIQRNAHKYDNPHDCIHMQKRVGGNQRGRGECGTAIAFGCGPWFVDEQVPIRWDVGRMKCWSGA